MGNEQIIAEINKIDEEISKMQKHLQNMPHNSIMKVYCIEIMKALDIREYLSNKLKEQNNGNKGTED